MLDEKRKNLKDTYYNLSYYRYVETGRTFPRKRTKKNSDDKFDVQIYQVPELEKRAFSEDEIRNFSLDTYGRHIPYVDGELTILNNYLFDYWVIRQVESTDLNKLTFGPRANRSGLFG